VEGFGKRGGSLPLLPLLPALYASSSLLEGFISRDDWECDDYPEDLPSNLPPHLLMFSFAPPYALQYLTLVTATPASAL